MSRFLSGRSIKLRHTFWDDEDALTPDNVTVTVTRAGADTPVAEVPAVPGGDVYTAKLAAIPDGVYTASWAGTLPEGEGPIRDDTRVEVVSGFLFSITEARDSDPDLTATRFPAERVRYYRDAVEAEFERITGRSFTPRTLYVPASKFGTPTDPFPVADVRSVVAHGASDGPLAVETAGPFAFWPEVPSGCTGLDISYGFTEPPEDVKRVGIVRLRWLLMAERSAIPDRATSYQPADGGTYTLATPGRAGYTTGIPDVDAVLDAYRFKILESVYLP